MRALLAILLAFTATVCAAQLPAAGGGLALPGGAQPSFLPVEQAYELAVDVLDDRRVRLYWQIADGYYLYQHRFDAGLTAADKSIDTELLLPPGEEKTDEYFGDVVVYYHSADLTAVAAEAPGLATLTVTSQGCADAGLCYPPQRQAFEIDFEARTASAIMPPPAAAPPELAAPPGANPVDGAALATMLLLAFIGGVILNLMPCVFPVLSLKALSFARATDHDRHLHSWVYAAGVVISFVLVAALLLGLREAGRAVGWGFQLQSPGFVIALAYLFVAMGLSLSGLVQFGGSLMNTGSGLANRGGLGGSFFTGVLAVVVASPCTAPFMGTALGFAISQPPQVALLVFAALGAGMASPLLLFGYSGAARAVMPRPGPWMETLKQFLAFPLYATAIWLLWIAGRQTGVDTMASALGGALLLALGLWAWDRRRWRQALALGCLAGAVLLGSVRGMDDENGIAQGEDRLAWSDTLVAELRGAGTPVFVDVTADWCITCKANEAAVLARPELAQAFASAGVTYLVADWTDYDPAIAGLLERHGRTGIPLYLMYPADPALPPLILPQILTRGAVLEAIEAVSVKNRELARVFPPDTSPFGTFPVKSTSSEAPGTASTGE